MRCSHCEFKNRKAQRKKIIYSIHPKCIKKLMVISTIGGRVGSNSLAHLYLFFLLSFWIMSRKIQSFYA